MDSEKGKESGEWMAKNRGVLSVVLESVPIQLPNTLTWISRGSGPDTNAVMSCTLLGVEERQGIFLKPIRIVPKVR